MNKVTKILTYSGQMFDFTDFENYKFNIIEIAHALSKLCRYTGHVNTDGIYSVAQHSVLVSKCAPDHLKREALLHDAEEAYTGDMNSPLKSMLPEFKVVQDKIEKAIFNYFGLQHPIDPAIKQCDLGLLYPEFKSFNTNENLGLLVQEYPFVESIKCNNIGTIKPLSSKDACKQFLDHWELYNVKLY